MSEVNRQEFDQLRAMVEKMSAEVAEHRAVHVSRRGVSGGRGETGAQGIQGQPGQSITGPQGVPGKSADVTEAVAAAKAALASDIAALHASVSGVVVQALKDAGVTDQAGKAILLVPRDGVDGKNGKDSVVPGPRGEKGESVTGASGKNGKDAQVSIGEISVGSQAAARVRVKDGISFIDLVIPRPEKGERGNDGASVAGKDGVNGVGTPGPRGPAGDISAAVHNVTAQLAAFKTEILALIAVSK